MSYPITNAKPSKKRRSSLTRSFHKLLSKARQFKKALPLCSKFGNLRDEINLLTSYSSDTVYRLRYNCMTYDYVSPAIVRLLGFSPEEMKKINFRSLILETKMVNNGMKDITSFEELEKSRKQGNVNKWQADYLMRTKDGRKIWVTDISCPWFNERGEIIGSVGSLRDISDRKSAEAKVQEEILRLANTDALTGIANRHTFFTTIDNEIKRFRRSQRHFSMLLIDVDHFKKINDELGHISGDKILIEISRIANSCIRDTDVVARLDGEEFGVFMPDTSEEGAFWVAERICKEISKHCFFVENSVIPVHLTVSIGVASTKGTTVPTIAELYKQADTRLYIAKHTGRNQVSVDEIVHVH